METPAEPRQADDENEYWWHTELEEADDEEDWIHPSAPTGARPRELQAIVIFVLLVVFVVILVHVVRLSLLGWMVLANAADVFAGYAVWRRRISPRRRDNRPFQRAQRRYAKAHES